MSVKRFYYQWAADGLSDHHEAWQVFDRNLVDRSGEVLPIYLCRTREHARSIVMLLNENKP